jgi:spermidine/putrescine transport system substrate-binding protein
MAWSGDMVQLQADNPKLKFNLPQSGGNIWTDNMMIPKGGDIYTASVFMDFVYDPKIAAQIEAYVNYICPVEGAKEEMLKLDKDIANNPLIFPDEETLGNVKLFDAAALNNQDYRKKFAALVGA